MIQHVILTGDFLAPRQSTQATDLRWVGDLLMGPIETVGLRCQLDFEIGRAGILARVGEGAAGFDEAGLGQIRRAIGADALIVGYELSAGTRGVLDRAGVAWIDMRLHPVRICDDVFMAFASGVAPVQARLARFAVHRDAGQAEAQGLKMTELAQSDPGVVVVRNFASPHFWAEILKDVVESAPARTAVIANFEAALTRAEVVSFDVFDTLIRRRVAEPRDVFARINLANPGFYQKRVDAAAKARRGAVGRDEVTFAEIYAHLDGFGPAVEFAFELSTAMPREAGKALFDAALRSGKRIVLVSDMYFSAVQIAELLTACGYAGWQALYVSSEIGAAKRTGRLWGHVLEREQIAPEQLFHIGDNPVGDIAKAAELGIRTHHLPMAAVGFAESGDFAREVAKALGWDASELLAYVQNDLADSGKVVWTAEAFGAAVLGPLLVGFAQWLEAQDFDRLHFLTREGGVMAAVFAVVSDGEFGELFASRALVAPLGVASAEDIERVIGGGLAEQSLAAFFQRQFGVDIAAWDLRGSGFPSAEDLIGVRTDRAALEALALAYREEILAACGAVRSRVQGYLVGQGVGYGSALVDIGYNGTVQRAYGDALGAEISGFYMGLLETADDLVSAGRAKGWLVQGVRKGDHGHAICKHRAIWEVLLCAPEGSVTGLTEAHGAVRSDARDLRRQAFVREAHAGAVRFAKEWVAAGNLAIPAKHAQAMIKAVLDTPDRGLAQLLKDLEFEDAFERQALRPLIGADAACSLWKEGFAALSQSCARQSSRRPKWALWGAYGVFGWRHVLPVFVGPVIGWIGEPQDVDRYKEDPIGFFRGLSDRNFRRVGRVLYPWSD